MGKPNYNFKPQVESKCAKARGSDLRCHFKNTRETVRVIRVYSLLQHRASPLCSMEEFLD